MATQRETRAHEPTSLIHLYPVGCRLVERRYKPSKKRLQEFIDLNNRGVNRFYNRGTQADWGGIPAQAATMIRPISPMWIILC